MYMQMIVNFNSSFDTDGLKFKVLTIGRKSHAPKYSTG